MDVIATNVYDALTCIAMVYYLVKYLNVNKGGA